MTRRSIIVLPPLAAQSAGALMLVPGAGHAASHTQTLRFFDKPVSMKRTHADGTVVANPQPLSRSPGTRSTSTRSTTAGTTPITPSASRQALTCGAGSAPARRRANPTSQSAARC
jgi:hypothetical protein